MEAIRAMTELSLVRDSKFKVYNYPPALPNKCIACGADHPGDNGERMFIDTGTSLEWYGAVYYCTLCFTEIANTFGYVSRDQHNFSIAGIGQLIVDLRELKKENDSLRTAVSTLADHRCPVSAESDVYSISESAAEDGIPAGEIASAGSDAGSDVDESSGIEGLSDIRGDANLHAGNSDEPESSYDDPLDNLL